MAACTSLGLMMMKRWTKSVYTVLLGKPRRQILMPYQGGVEQQGGLVVVRYNASDEVGVGLVEGG